MAVELLFLSKGNLDCQLIIEEGEKYIYTTPRNSITPLSWEYIKAFGFYERSLLPNGIVWTKESNKFIQAITHLENEFRRVTKPEEKKKDG